MYTDDKQPSGLDAKATPVDADVAVVGDSADSGRMKQTTFAQLRTWIEAFTSYFNVTSDTLDDITDGATYVKSTNDFTDDDHTKIDGIEALADVTDATNVNAAGATMNVDTDVSANGWVLDEDDLTTDSNTKVPTQQSVKAYVDSTTVSDYQAFTSSGTWTKPATVSGDELVVIHIWGAGGAGGSRASDSPRGTGSGGGGGFQEIRMKVSELGATETVTIGAGGVAQAADVGTAGGNSTFGSWVTGYGGGGGYGGTGNWGDNAWGGGGGGMFGAGATGSLTAALGGSPNADDVGFGGADGTDVPGDNQARARHWGGAGGHLASGGTAYDGSNAVWGGGSGGGGVYGATGGAGGVSLFGGDGGVGGTSSADGGAGVQPAGGGGSCYQQNGNGVCTGGAGADGEVRVWVLV